MKASINEINQRHPKQETFFLSEIIEREALEVMKKVPKNKATVFEDIPMRIIKKSAHVYTHRLNRDNVFSDILNYLKHCETLKYLNIFVKRFYNQINLYMEPKFPKHLVELHRYHNTEQSLLRIIKSMASHAKYRTNGGIIIDLSTAFNTLNHKLVLKLQA